ncbi:MAG: hypothetical protein JXQ66_03485 [Campylobacterales bacterium]|nr:hypothetical protein [Campylobacterales bacterium]
MKVLGWLVGLLTTLVVGVYVLAFTSLGNSIVKPIVEQKIQEATGIKVRLSEFSLDMSNFLVVLEIDSQNSIEAKGSYSIGEKSFDALYDVKLNRLENLRDFASGTLIAGKFHTDGSAKGDMKFITIDGKSDVASSSTSYHVELTEFNPTSIIAKIDKANLAELLEIAGQKSYASADLDLDVNFKNIKPHQLDGDVVLKTSNGLLNTKVMKNDFNITIPKTAFAMNLDAKLLGDDVNYKYALKSNLANLTSSGKVTPEPLKTDIKYGVDVSELAVLKPIIGTELRGALKLNGTLKGTKEKMVVDGFTDIASSDTVFVATLKDFAPANIKAKVKSLKLQKLLYMVNQPHYTDGDLNLDIDIADAKSGSLKGSVVNSISNGLLDSAYLTKEYEFKSAMPKTTYTLKTVTKLSGDIADTKVNLASNLADLDIKSAKFNIAKGSLESDYEAKIAELERLYFVTAQHMRGGLNVNGEIKKGTDLDFTAHTKVADGVIDAKLHNDNFHADLKGVKTIKLLNMLIYPEIFDSSLEAKVDYNLAKQKGFFDGHVKEGKFTQNLAFDMAKQYANIDMYKESFEGDVNADINKENILAGIYLVSRTSHIRTKDAKLNTKEGTIDAKIDINANNNPIGVKLSGKTTAPKVEVDASSIIKNEAKKAIEKKLGDKLPADVGNLLKGFF